MVIISLIPYNKLRLKDYMLREGECISDDLIPEFSKKGMLLVYIL